MAGPFDPFSRERWRRLSARPCLQWQIGSRRQSARFWGKRGWLTARVHRPHGQRACVWLRARALTCASVRARKGWGRACLYECGWEWRRMDGWKAGWKDGWRNLHPRSGLRQRARADVWWWGGRGHSGPGLWLKTPSSWLSPPLLFLLLTFSVIRGHILRCSDFGFVTPEINPEVE